MDSDCLQHLWLEFFIILLPDVLANNEFPLIWNKLEKIYSARKSLIFFLVQPQRNVLWRAQGLGKEAWYGKDERNVKGILKDMVRHFGGKWVSIK